MKQAQMGRHHSPEGEPVIPSALHGVDAMATAGV